MARLSDTNNIERSKCTTDGCQALIECNLIPFQPPRLSFLFAQMVQWTGLVGSHLAETSGADTHKM